jgi:hypothetical protein
MLSVSAEGWDPGIELDSSESPVLDVSGVYLRDTVMPGTVPESRSLPLAPISSSCVFSGASSARLRSPASTPE